MKGTLEERLWAQTLEDPILGCWLWQGYLNDQGYGLMKVSGRQRKAHRLMWEQQHGPVPVGQELHHVCENRRCVNPEHLKVVTRYDHVALNPKNLAWINAMKDYCKNGLVFNETNTIWRRNGYRDCRICQRHRERQYRERHSKGVQFDFRFP